jgi:beta-aspartyl-peptidase (threonine type)
MKNARPVIVVHGGAGTIKDQSKNRRLDGCRTAAMQGWRVLTSGASAVQAVVAAVKAMEDNPVFNAGRGAALNAAGQVQLDASIMDGATLKIGAVAAVQRVRNPIALACKVLEDGRHVLLVSQGAERFARDVGIPLCATANLIVVSQRSKWEARHGTVGCVALDHDGTIAAGTSTGGRFDALPGRVGDSALIGSGTYANRSGGVSCTGIGEDIIRVVLAKTAVESLRSGCDPFEAAGKSIEAFQASTNSEAGLILVDGQGRVGYAQNSKHMPVCVVQGNDQVHTAL